MALEFFKEKYAGGIKEIKIGKGDNAITVGGETCYPFYDFEGDMPNKPKIAMEVWDMPPEDWPPAVMEIFGDVISDPAAWAKKCVDEYGAKVIALQLKSIDPNGKDASPDEAVETVKKVLAAVDVPLIVWGCTNPQKDEEVFKAIGEKCQDTPLIMGPVEDKNHKGIGASAMGFGHYIISSSPIDVNLAKQVNILLENLGMPMDRVMIDPTTGGLGYGLEYSYSVMERIRQAALNQGDDKLQFPIVNNLANEVWKSKEAKQPVDEDPSLGDPERRAIMMEAVGAVSYLVAGSDLLIMRHPEAVRLTREFIELLANGGSAEDLAGVEKKLEEPDIDYAKLAPEPDLTIEEEKKPAAPAKKPEKPAEEKPKAEAKPAEKPAPAAAPKVEEQPAVEKKKTEEELKAEAEADAKAKAEAEQKAKAEAEAKKKAEEEAKKKAEEEAKKKAEEEEKRKAEEAEAARKAKVAEREAEEEKIRQKRQEEREKREAVREDKEVEVTLTPAKEQKSPIDKLMEKLDQVHRRSA